jgi:hypothetical protein
MAGESILRMMVMILLSGADSAKQFEFNECIQYPRKSYLEKKVCLTALESM